jgi:hypothetical protein
MQLKTKFLQFGLLIYILVISFEAEFTVRIGLCAVAEA